jgi:hypothetical protein
MQEIEIQPRVNQQLLYFERVFELSKETISHTFPIKNSRYLQEDDPFHTKRIQYCFEMVNLVTVLHDSILIQVYDLQCKQIQAWKVTPGMRNSPEILSADKEYQMFYAQHDLDDNIVPYIKEHITHDLGFITVLEPLPSYQCLESLILG